MEGIALLARAWRALALLVLLLAPAGAAAQGGRVALVIGNAAYQHTARLANPPNDTADMAALLRRLGFEVTLRQDLDRPGMVAALRDFGQAAAGAEIALLFYAGHAVQAPAVEGGRIVNYLLPVSAQLLHEADLSDEAIGLDGALARLEGARNVVVLLDACRDNPLAERMQRRDGQRNVGAGSRGLGRVAAESLPRGVLLGYATAPGRTAADGRGRNSPYTTALLEHLGAEGIGIAAALQRVSASVAAATRQQQLPEVVNRLPADLVLAPGAGRPQPPARSEIEAWRAVRDSGDATALRRFIEDFPEGDFAEAARARLAALAPTRPPARPPAPPVALPLPGLPDPPLPAELSRIAAPGRSGWTEAIGRPGCRLWNAAPDPGETVTWDGPCRDGLAHGSGNGEWRSPSGVQPFSGEVRRGLLHGQATTTWRGVRYEGAFLAGRRTGIGVFTWTQAPGGRRYEGEVRDNRAHGQGTLVEAGRVFSGIWENGCLWQDGRAVAAVGLSPPNCAARR